MCGKVVPQARSQADLIYEFFHENEKALLIVLDACNWRVLSSLKPDWKINVVLSRGSSTTDWLKHTFTKPLKDVVYISANPYTFLLRNVRKNFKRVIDLPLIVWNEKLNTVHPSSVNAFVKENIVTGENKIIAHYIQPHAPFLTRTWLNKYTVNLKEWGKKPMEFYELARKFPSLRKKIVPEIVRAYVSSLAVLLKYVEELIDFVKGDMKVIVTADHSEILKPTYNPYNFRKKIWLWLPWLLGIYKFMGHEGNSKLRELYEVPWVAF